MSIISYFRRPGSAGTVLRFHLFLLFSGLVLQSQPAVCGLVTDSVQVGHIVCQLHLPAWGQRAPFNAETPKLGGKATLTGCLPIALAAIMRYWQWPESSRGYAEPYETPTAGIAMPSRPFGHVYDWGSMPLSYDANSGTDGSLAAVAGLVADIGAALKADYGIASTSAGLDRWALAASFGYHPRMHWAWRTEDDDAWKSLLKSELDLGRPVLYHAESDSSSHAFVVDGYTDTGLFHLTWGWGGKADGFYSLDDIKVNGVGYHHNHAALLGFYPYVEPPLADCIALTYHNDMDKLILSYEPDIEVSVYTEEGEEVCSGISTFFYSTVIDTARLQAESYRIVCQRYFDTYCFTVKFENFHD